MFQVRAWLSGLDGGVGAGGWADGGFWLSGIGSLSLGLPLNTRISLRAQEKILS